MHRFIYIFVFAMLTGATNAVAQECTVLNTPRTIVLSGQFDGVSILHDGGSYKMWFGSGGSIQLATSSDGIAWVDQGVVLSAGACTWNRLGISNPTVVRVGTTYHMWLVGSAPLGTPSPRIGHATSPNGINWAVDCQPTTFCCTGPFVRFDGATFTMWYATSAKVPPNGIGSAVSTDGTNWQGSSSGLSPSQPWEFQVVDNPTVAYGIDDHGVPGWHMYYDNAGTGGGKIGEANSADGVVWTKCSDNPVLVPAPGRGFVEYPEIVPGSPARLYYVGQELGEYGLRYVQAVNPTPAFRNTWGQLKVHYR